MPTLVRHVTPVPRAAASGLVAEVYAQVEAEFSSIGPAVLMTSPAPELMAAGWSLMREAQLAGDVPVLDKALVALGVAQANELDYDVQAFLAILRLLGEDELADAAGHGRPPADPRHAALLTWARATATGPVAAPFPAAQAAEHLGTALFGHFVNRMAAAMLPAGLTPGSMDPGDEPAFDGAPVLRGMREPLAPGATLPLLKGLPAGQEPAWAAGRPIGAAYAALAAGAAQGAGLLSPAAAATVTTAVAAHRGRRRARGPWLEQALDGLPEQDRAGARAAILTALAPQDLTDADVAAWRATDRRFSDHCTVYLLAFGAMAAVGHLADDTAAALYGT
ncbi:DNA-binding protein [Actinomadura sp. ATCC 31491]|uniref:DNA-binding protein n=1 Tax=Actinomadura luzonensis TaxID=2805427 RepID=A0ABT0G164_9ACTN|nr:DNA-binding protein [Actinomadura luzonensis]MCK2218302.1 DNA-binding protein [Actinomadura luzonensis]